VSLKETVMNPDFIQNEVENGLSVGAALHTRERYLAAVVQIQQKLLVSQNPRDVYQEALDILGHASGASRVYVFENCFDSKGRLLTSQKAEWCAAGIEPEIDNSALQNLDFEDYSQNWVSVLLRGEIINGLVKDFLERERELLKPQGVLSILILPLIVSGELFGFIGFDNCAEERVWDESQVELLHAAAQAFCLAHERMRAEQERIESEEFFSKLFDNAGDLVYTTDLKGNFLSANKTCLRITGYAEEEFPNLKMKDIVAPEYVDFVREMAALKIEGKTSETVYEAMILTKDGRRIPIETSSRLIYHDGKPVAIQGISRDITKRKRAEAELIASQERFFKAFNASPVSLVISRLEDGLILDVNETTLEFHGYKREEAIGRKSSDLPVWADPNERAKVATMLLEQGFVRGYEAVLLDKGGNGRTVLISAELLTLNGETCALWVSNDITERKHAEEALKLSEERYRSLLAATSQSIWSADAEGTVLEFQANAGEGKRLLSDVVGWKWLDLVHTEDRERVRKKWRHSVETGEMYVNEFRILNAAGSYRCVICRAVPIPGPDGKVREWIGSVADITEAREAERALRASEERYRMFVENSSEAIWRIELEEACPITLAPEEQIEWIYRHGYLAECNDVMAKMYNFDNMQEIIGVRLNDLLPPSNPASIEYLKKFISSGYRLINAESEEMDKYGQKKFFLNNLVGIIENWFVTTRHNGKPSRRRSFEKEREPVPRYQRDRFRLRL
jgi:PAS domain S-box-containing protein